MDFWWMFNWFLMFMLFFLSSGVRFGTFCFEYPGFCFEILVCSHETSFGKCLMLPGGLFLPTKSLFSYMNLSLLSFFHWFRMRKQWFRMRKPWFRRKRQWFWSKIQDIRSKTYNKPNPRTRKNQNKH